MDRTKHDEPPKNVLSEEDIENVEVEDSGSSEESRSNLSSSSSEATETDKENGAETEVRPPESDVEIVIIDDEPGGQAQEVPRASPEVVAEEGEEGEEVEEESEDPGGESYFLDFDEDPSEAEAGPSSTRNPIEVGPAVLVRNDIFDFGSVPNFRSTVSEQHMEDIVNEFYWPKGLTITRPSSVWSAARPPSGQTAVYWEHMHARLWFPLTSFPREALEDLLVFGAVARLVFEF